MDNSEIQQLREALAVSPDNVYLRVILVQALLRTEQWSDAQNECLEILKRDSENTSAKMYLAQTYFGKGEFGPSIIVLEEVLQNNPERVDALLLLTRAFLKEGDRRQAIDTYKKIKSINPHRVEEEIEQELTLKSVDETDRDSSNFSAQVEKQVQPPSPTSISFAQVGGMEKEKDEIKIKIIHPLNHPDLYQAYGKKIGGGILFYGPPGCGKTYLARATAGEINSAFISVGINDILDMYIGESEKKLNLLFEQARSSSPCVLFFDEIDALGANRSDMRTSAGRNLINQFLSELDGIESQNDGLLVIGATNAPWHLDPAFRRPGRFDKIIFVQPPDLSSRKAIYRVALANKPVDNIDYEKPAKIAKDFSGADIKASVDLAIENKLRIAMKKGAPTPITTQDLVSAIRKIKPSTKEWFQTAKNYAMYANESGIYDEILAYLKIKK